MATTKTTPAKATRAAAPATATAEDAATATREAQAESADSAASGQTAAPPPPLLADPDTARPYLVGAVPIRHNGQSYGVGREIWLTDREADRLCGLLSPISE